MNRKNIILFGLFASLLLIVLCVSSNAERYYEELALGKNKMNVEFSSLKNNDEIHAKETIAKEIIEKETIAKEPTSFFSFYVKDGQQYMKGELPFLESNDPLQQLILACTAENTCEERVDFVDSYEKIEWKPLLVAMIGLFEKVDIENPQILIEKKNIKIQGVFKDQESKDQLSSLLVDFKLPYKIYDMTTKKVIKKPSFRIIKDDIEKLQEKLSKRLKERPIRFKRNSKEITTQAKALLDEFVSTLKEPEHLLIEIQGHADVGGSKRLNLEISELRASAVKKYLMKKGLSASNISVKGFGDSQLLLPHNPYSALNRRVEIYLKRK